MLASGSKGHGSISGSHMGDRRSTPLLSGDRIENRLKKPTTFLCKMNALFSSIDPKSPFNFHNPHLGQAVNTFSLSLHFLLLQSPCPKSCGLTIHRFKFSFASLTNRFRNELPDPSAKIKLMSLKRDPDRYCKYQITSLEKNWKPQLYVEPDLGIPLDLLDLSVYNPPKGERIPLDPEDEELLRDDDPITPIKTDGIKKKERPTDKGVSWLVKTQYISPLSMDSTKQSLSEKQAKELRESRGRNLLENLNSRERKIQDIVDSFEACKSKPVHSVNPDYNRKGFSLSFLILTEMLVESISFAPCAPLVFLCTLCTIVILYIISQRYDDQFVVANIDSAPTADSEIYRKLSAAERNEYEHRAIMKSYVSSSSDAENPYKFLAYMVPSIDEIEKDIYDENEDVTYSWVREYHFDLLLILCPVNDLAGSGDNVDDPTTYLVTFGESEAKYLPLPTKFILRKKRARDGKSNEDMEQFPVPKSVTVRRRPTVAVHELRDDGDFVDSKVSSRSGRGGMDGGGGGGRLRRIVQETDPDNFSGAEDDMSE
ncbi:hypothetical protein DH2020_013261 [Rehmannia glutinosa]|uniref:RNA polymerase II-associated factor 1 homolog n=1 Tax=Rehmannia glutinosa TaxID=99300 RepID=A0ABR0X1U5_REHGL